MEGVLAFLQETLLLYNNNSWLFLLFLISVIYLFFTEKNRRTRTVYVYLVILLVFVFCCPIYVWIGKKIDEEIYYRVFWALPIGTVVCYSMVKVIAACKKKVAKVVVCFLAVGMICLNGKLVYQNTIHVKSTNAYHIPQFVIDVADALYLERYNPNVAMSAELLPFIRQYTGNILTPYGRNILEKRWGFTHPLYDAMEAEVYQADEIAKCARESQCLFVVLSSIKQLNGNLEDYGFYYKEFVSGYYVYVNWEMYEAILNQGLFTQEEIEELQKIVQQ